MTFMQELRQANIDRNEEWDPEHKINLGFRVTEFFGEAGELANLLKKIMREDMGMVGSRAKVEDIADEFADVLICLDLLAMNIGINLEYEVRRKFNATSVKYGLKTRIEE